MIWILNLRRLIWDLQRCLKFLLSSDSHSKCLRVWICVTAIQFGVWRFLCLCLALIGVRAQVYSACVCGVNGGNPHEPWKLVSRRDRSTLLSLSPVHSCTQPWPSGEDHASFQLIASFICFKPMWMWVWVKKLKLYDIRYSNSCVKHGLGNVDKNMYQYQKEKQ